MMVAVSGEAIRLVDRFFDDLVSDLIGIAILDRLMPFLSGVIAIHVVCASLDREGMPIRT